MILKQIYLENWKLFREPIEIKFTDGLNVVYGLNESGKSTLINSLHTVLFSKFNSKSEDIKSLQPWNSRLSPKAVITFQNDGVKYRIQKKFLIEPESILESFNNGNWELTAKRAESDNMVADIVGGKINNPRKKGLTKSNWGLGQSLWMIQGEPIIDETENLNDETVTGLGSMINASIESDEEKRIIKRVDDQYKSIFKKNKSLLPSSRLKKLDLEIEDCKSRLNAVDDNVTRKEELIRKLEDSEILLNENEKSLKIVKNELKKLQKDIEEANQHELERQNIEGDLKRNEYEYTSLKEKFDDLILYNKKISDLNLQNMQLTEEKGKIEKELSNLTNELNQSISSFKELKVKIDKVEDERNNASIAKNTIQEEIRVSLMEPRLEELKELINELNEKKKYFNSIIAPSSSDLKNIQKIHSEIRDIKSKLEASGLTIKGHSEHLVSGTISLDGKITNLNFPTQEKNWSAYQSVKLNIDTVGEFNIKSGSQDVKELQKLLKNKEENYKNFLDLYKCKDLDEVIERFRTKENAKTDCNRINDILDKRFEDNEKSLELKINNLKNKINLNWNSIPIDSPYNFRKKTNIGNSEEWLAEKLQKLRDIIKKLKIDLNELDGFNDNLLIQQKECEGEISSITNKIDTNNNLIESYEDRIDKLKSAGINENKTEKELGQISLEIEREKSALKVLKAEMEDKEKKPKDHYTTYQNKQSRLKTENMNIKLEINRKENDLKHLLSKFENTNKMEENLKLKEDERKKLEIDSEAIKLLYELNHHFRDETTSSLTAPIQKLVSKNLKKLIGPKYPGIELDISLKPNFIKTGREETATINTLSFGTQEQIWCLFRLALGKLLSNDEKQLVVLDDPFVNTDKLRMNKALEILEESAKELQIILLTCNLGDYELIPNANLIQRGSYY